ncbi:collagen alpha-1(III) chain-like [Antechinus flavipes]|uniref:collagen alpha-1(III) chain-like n=1 Tax=Antechinus flavipes TaxID=38775 RepID=UPI002235537C|nr:collagen alpha-1(III) chain-like [Antechinus flavipes]
MTKLPQEQTHRVGKGSTCLPSSSVLQGSGQSSEAARRPQDPPLGKQGPADMTDFPRWPIAAPCSADQVSASAWARLGPHNTTRKPGSTVTGPGSVNQGNTEQEEEQGEEGGSVVPTVLKLTPTSGKAQPTIVEVTAHPGQLEFFAFQSPVRPPGASGKVQTKCGLGVSSEGSERRGAGEGEVWGAGGGARRRDSPIRVPAGRAGPAEGTAEPGEAGSLCPPSFPWELGRTAGPLGGSRGWESLKGKCSQGAASPRPRATDSVKEEQKRALVTGSKVKEGGGDPVAGAARGSQQVWGTLAPTYLGAASTVLVSRRQSDRSSPGKGEKAQSSSGREDDPRAWLPDRSSKTSGFQLTPLWEGFPGPQSPALSILQSMEPFPRFSGFVQLH